MSRKFVVKFKFKNKIELCRKIENNHLKGNKVLATFFKNKTA